MGSGSLGGPTCWPLIHTMKCRRTSPEGRPRASACPCGPDSHHPISLLAHSESCKPGWGGTSCRVQRGQQRPPHSHRSSRPQDSRAREVGQSQGHPGPLPPSAPGRYPLPSRARRHHPQSLACCPHFQTRTLKPQRRGVSSWWKRKARGPRDCPSPCGEQPQPHVLGDWPSRPSLNQMQGCPAQDTNMLKRNRHLPLAGEFLPMRQEAHGPQMVVTVLTSQALAHRVAGGCGLRAGVHIPHAPP